MHPARKQRLQKVSVLLLVLGLALSLVLYALRQNISLFYSPSQIVRGEAPLKRGVRVGGMVEKGSILRVPKTLEVQFKITDYKETITVAYRGILPDLFREGQGIVAEGEVTGSHSFLARQVLAKHDANYMPPEVKAALAQKGSV
ncbi:MAG: cytochrome c maturation protein CcmE [Legionellales bacterium]